MEGMIVDQIVDEDFESDEELFAADVEVDEVDEESGFSIERPLKEPLFNAYTTKELHGQCTLNTAARIILKLALD
jgi:hypothetical protein